MTPEDYSKVEELLHEALRLPAAERPAFLARVADSPIRIEVASLLKAQGAETGDASIQDAIVEATQFALKDSLYGSIFGNFKLLDLIGSGGMGDVWLAEQKAPVRRRVALKLIKVGMDTREIVARFESERQALALMDHPAIAKIFDAGATLEGRPYFVMEFVQGLPITTYCDKHNLNLRERLELFMAVCDAVQHAHQKAIIHRDLKPSNILVCEIDGKPCPKIIDFGVAKAMSQRLTADTLFTRVGAIIGTPEYISPEQADSWGQDVDTRSDVYSLGVVLYELLVGILPMDYRDLAFDEILRILREQDAVSPSSRLRTTLSEQSALIAKHRRTEPRTLSRQLRGDLDSITLKALEKDRSRRYGAPSELAADIERYLCEKPIAARRSAPFYRARKYVSRHKFAVFSTVSLIALLVGFVGTKFLDVRRLTEERNRSDRITRFMIGMFKVPNRGFGPGLTITAEEILKEATRHLRNDYAKDPVTQSRLMRALAEVYAGLGANLQAEPLIRETIRIQTQVLGLQDRETLRSLGVLVEIKGFDEPATEKTLRGVLESQRRVLGDEDEDTLHSMAWLGVLLAGKKSAAGKNPSGDNPETLLRMALDGQTRVLGRENQETQRTLLNLIHLLLSKGKFGDAEHLAREQWDMAQRSWPPEDTRSVGSLWTLANVLSLEGNYGEAEKLTRELVEVERRAPPHEKENLFIGRDFLRLILMKEGKYSEAAGLAEQQIVLERAVFGPNHPRVGKLLYDLAAVAVRSGQPDKAVSLLKDAFVHGFDSDDLAMLKGDKNFEALRRTPRFDAFLLALEAQFYRASVRK